MKHVRIVVTALVLCILTALALFTDAFWWFVEPWQDGTLWLYPSPGDTQLTLACWWALVHGLLSTPILAAAFIAGYDKHGMPPAAYPLLALFAFAVSAGLTSVADVASGWWMFVGDGTWIPYCYGAFLQGFLTSYALVILLTPSKVFKTGNAITSGALTTQASC